ncbi:MAG: molybdopterin molybdotransferase MoeA, partial [Synergistaceae bacterium]|nr:molybdopterin molybdotransferase MoeA [Synergistaceae bacterium]
RTPTFLNKTGDIPMGALSDISIRPGNAAGIPTGGVLPDGADAVVMLENTSFAGGWVEVRSAVQSGENVIHAGEEFTAGKNILSRGDMVDFRSMSILATLGIKTVSAADLKINVLSTGDEIVPIETKPLQPGKIRDVNGWSLKSLLMRYGFDSEHRGILSDEGGNFEKKLKEEAAQCDVLILSGGSSVGTRDHCSKALEKLAAPGLMVRGINIVPGKPTLIAGCLEEKKLVVSLPGHPLSCVTVAFVLLIPLLLKLIGAKNTGYGTKLKLTAARDITARTGPEEFIPCKITDDGKIDPILAKSGYVSSLASAEGFICIPEVRETIRAGEAAEVWLW